MQYSTCPTCRHIKTNGRRCQAPAMATSAFCYHHQKMRRTRPRTISAGPGLSRNVLHPLRHAEGIQQALAMVLTGIASQRIPVKQGNAMLYALQIASNSLKEAQ